jgi:hypothetical protein
LACGVARPGAGNQAARRALAAILLELLCSSLNGAESLYLAEAAAAARLTCCHQHRGCHGCELGRRHADDPGARHELALALLELLGAPLGAWRSSNDAAAAADAADALPPALAAALGALGGGCAAAPETAPGAQPPAAWLDPDGFFDALGDGDSDAGAAGAGAPRRAPPMHAWFQARQAASAGWPAQPCNNATVF